MDQKRLFMAIAISLAILLGFQYLISPHLPHPAVPQPVLFKIFSGLASGLSSEQLQPFIANLHLALWVLAGISLLGAGISMLRPAHVREHAQPAFEHAA